jgi:putative transposase
MKPVADTLGVARSNLSEQAQKHFISSQATGMARARPGDHEVLPAIQRLVAERPSYGYSIALPQ